MIWTKITKLFNTEQTNSIETNEEANQNNHFKFRYFKQHVNLTFLDCLKKHFTCLFHN